MCETMAIPFNLPTDEQTEDNYSRLDQLLVDLYSVLRQILLRPRCAPLSNQDDSRGPAPGGSRPAADVTGSRHRDLPDVVSSALSAAPCQCPCRRRPQRRQTQRRRQRTSNYTCCPEESREQQSLRVDRPLHMSRSQQEDNWLIAGEHLRKIAEELRATFISKQEVAAEKQEAQRAQGELEVECKTSSLFSLLVPAQLRSSVWTTVILLVGWRLLIRSR